jgi:hypothetical protein
MQAQPDEREDEGPSGWLLPDLESAYSRLRARGVELPPVSKERAPFTSTLQPGEGVRVLGEIASTAWVELLAEYKRRKVLARIRRPLPIVAGGVIAPGAPIVPGGRN